MITDSNKQRSAPTDRNSSLLCDETISSIDRTRGPDSGVLPIFIHPLRLQRRGALAGSYTDDCVIVLFSSATRAMAEEETCKGKWE